MAILNDSLSVWEIGFRWGGYDPRGIRARLTESIGLQPPLPVRDNFRLLMDAIVNGHLYCDTLSLRKYFPETSDGAGPEFFIRHHMDQVDACVVGRKFEPRLLRWALIARWAMQDWCKGQGVPLPEFWFPSGWKTEFEWSEDDSFEGNAEQEANTASESNVERKERVSKADRIRMACQQVALSLWKKEGDPRSTIKEIANRMEIQDLAGGSEYEFETVLKWLGEVDPRNSSKKRGRKRGKNSDSGDLEAK